jgi:hypothetical protein
MKTPILALALAAALSAQDPAPLLDRVPAGFENVLQVRDVLPAVERLLAAPVLDAACKESAQHLAVLDPDFDPVPPRALLGPLALIRAQVPTELVLAMPAATAADLGALYRAAMTAGFGWMVVERGKIDEPLLAGYREVPAEVLAAIGEPRLFVGLRARSPRVAEAWFDALVDAVDALPEAAVARQVDDGGLRARTTLGALLDLPTPRGPSLWQALSSTGAYPAGDPATAALRAGLDGLRLGLEVRIDGDVLEVRLGPGDPPAAEPAPGAAVDPAALVAAAWDLGGFQDEVLELLTLASSFGAATIEHLEATEPGRYERFLSTAGSLYEPSATGSLRLLVDEGGGELRVTTPLSTDPDWTPPAAAATAVADFVPARATLVASSGFYTLDEWLMGNYTAAASTLLDLGGEAALRGLAGLGEQATDAAVRMLVEFEDLHDFLAGEDSAVFADGVLFVLDLDEGGAPGVALVGAPTTPGAGRAFVETLGRRLLEGLDLDADTPTRAIALPGGPELQVFALPGAPADAAALAGAALALHAVVRDEVVILSTRTALTGKLLAAGAGEGRRALDPDLVSDAWSHGAGLAALLRAAVPLASAVGGAPEQAEVAAVLEGLAVFAALCGRLRATERLDGETWTAVFRLELRDD